MTSANDNQIVPASPDVNADLGFGSVVTRELRRRLLNRDGSFNVRREGLPLMQTLSAYHYLLTISWPLFFVLVAIAYLVVNVIFALAYVACGPGALSGVTNSGMTLRLRDAFFFSVDSLATIGYGNIAPQTLAANLLVTFESLVGLLGFGLVAGVMFARFSRPVARILFSENAIIAPFRGKTAFMFRIVNQKSNQIVEMEAKVLLARRKKGSADGNREFIPLNLERERVVFFPLAWTIVHPIDERSPLWGVREGDLEGCDAEFLIMLNGFDETFSQTVHARSSYRADEVVWGARYLNMFEPPREGVLIVDIRKLHEIERVPLPQP